MPQPLATRAPERLPRVVAWLGYGGLLPFLALAALAVLGLVPGWPVLPALLAYGAIILAFVGALHWGFATALPGLAPTRRAGLFAWSVVPALLAFPALLLPPRAGALLLVAGFLAHYLRDRRLAAQEPLPAWYLPLRLQLTAVAVACVLVGSWLGA